MNIGALWMALGSVGLALVVQVVQACQGNPTKTAIVLLRAAVLRAANYAAAVGFLILAIHVYPALNVVLWPVAGTITASEVAAGLANLDVPGTKAMVAAITGDMGSKPTP